MRKQKFHAPEGHKIYKEIQNKVLNQLNAFVIVCLKIRHQRYRHSAFGKKST